MKLLHRVLPFLLLAASAHAEWMDRSSSIFFPPELKSQITASQGFPVFWWNFLVLEDVGMPETDSASWEWARSTCGKLKTLPPDKILRAECETRPSEFAPVLRDWARDLMIRSPMPPLSEIQPSLNRVLSQASLPMGDSGLLGILSQDPFETWKSLKARAEKRIPIQLERVQGYFYDAPTKRLLIPVQLGFAPHLTQPTREFLSALPAGPEGRSWVLVGAHSSTLQNEKQIIDDSDIVSKVGLFVLALFAIGLYATGMFRLVLLFGVVLLGTGASFVLTKLVFGSVHGLTISFGTAIVGLAMDYAFQAVLNSRTESIWRSNFCGLSTTTAGLLVLMTSSIPLLRQMMFFAVMGLGISFAFTYWILHRFGHRFAVDAVSRVPEYRPWKALATLALVTVACVAVFTTRPALDMRQFDFQKPREKQVSQWIFQSLNLKPPLFQIHSGDAAEWAEKEWADANGIRLENRAEYAPAPATQQQNFDTWKTGWEKLTQSLSPTQQKFFAPFFGSPPEFPSGVRRYLSHLTNEASKTITLWFPKSDAEETSIRQRFPQTTSMREVVSIFPRTLSHELAWMTPLSLFLAALFHFIYYRRLSFALIALLPFFTGAGLIALSTFVFHFEISFVSIVGLIMVFGFSLDYGIFATDACLNPERRGMWRGITLAAVSTVAGFVPLVVCKHPVLRDLGQTLFYGGVGTYLGAIWGIPSVLHPLKRNAS